MTRDEDVAMAAVPEYEYDDDDDDDAIDDLPLSCLPLAMRGKPPPPQYIDSEDLAYEWHPGGKRAAVLSMAHDSRSQEALAFWGIKGTHAAEQLRIHDQLNNHGLRHVGAQRVWNARTTTGPVGCPNDLARVAFEGSPPYVERPNTRAARRSKDMGVYNSSWAATKQVFERVVIRLKEDSRSLYIKKGEALEKDVMSAARGDFVLVSYVGLTFDSFAKRLADLMRLKGFIVRLLKEEAKKLGQEVYQADIIILDEKLATTIAKKARTTSDKVVKHAEAWTAVRLQSLLNVAACGGGGWEEPPWHGTHRACRAHAQIMLAGTQGLTVHDALERTDDELASIVFAGRRDLLGFADAVTDMVRAGQSVVGVLAKGGRNGIDALKKRGKFIFILVWATRMTSCFVYRIRPPPRRLRVAADGGDGKSIFPCVLASHTVEDRRGQALGGRRRTRLGRGLLARRRDGPTHSSREVQASMRGDQEGGGQGVHDAKEGGGEGIKRDFAHTCGPLQCALSRRR